jgi:hypothetical protein
MNNKMMFEYVTMVFVAALTATLATVPLKYAAAQNATMPLPSLEDRMTAPQLKVAIAALKAQHPIFAGILDKVQSMNVTETLKAIVAADELTRILNAHARNILLLEPRHHV